jgi:Uma2 family endonuclease
MTTLTTSSKRFKVGTIGWTADDLDDPEIERRWERGRYEIVEGVLTRMPAAYFEGAFPLGRLLIRIQRHLDAHGPAGDFAPEVDLILNRRRVAVADLIFMTPEDVRRQREAHARHGRPRPGVRFGRLRVPPTLVIESVSPGHAEHDTETKSRWYAEAGVPNYWLLRAYRRALDCLVLEGDTYRVDQAGRENDQVRPSVFPGLVLSLAELWDA